LPTPPLLSLKEKLSEPFEILLVVATVPVQISPGGRDNSGSFQTLEPIRADFEPPTKMGYPHFHSPPVTCGGYGKQLGGVQHA